MSRAWLYREPSIRELISRSRSASDRPIVARSPQRASADSLRQMTDALRADLVRLKQENHDLREQLARKLGEQRAHSTRQRRLSAETCLRRQHRPPPGDRPTELEITVDLGGSGLGQLSRRRRSRAGILGARDSKRAAPW